MSDQLTALLNQHVETIKTTIDAEIKSAIDKHAPRHNSHIPWATSGPIGRDSAGYSLLRAASFAKGMLSADQRR